MSAVGIMAEEFWVKDVHAFLNKGPGILVRLRGLPYESTAADVLDFFRRTDPVCDVKDGEEGVFFVKKSDGKSTGEAFVMFDTELAANAAMTKHRNTMGTRYIELFRMASSDMEQVVRRTLEVKSRPTIPRAQIAVAPIQPPPHGLPTGATKNCIRMRGLPYEAQVQDILDFLGTNAASIAFKGVHMVYNVMGQPTGEVFVQMETEAAATRAAVQCHNRIMVAGKKQHYVDVVQCSGDDIVVFLAEPPPVSSPGMETRLMHHFDPGTYYPAPIPKLPTYSMPPPGYAQWSTESASSSTKTTTTDSLPQVAKPTELEVMSQYSYYTPANPMFMMPRIHPMAYYPKPTYSPIVLPQLTPLGMGLLGMKRSWEQAFPLETPIQAAKRWHSAFPSPFYSDA